MKKSFVTLLLVCLAAGAFAADLPKQGFGLQIGWAQPILRLNTNTSKDSLATTVKLNGFKVGLVYDASYIAGFGSSMGLNYTFGVSNSGWKSNNAYGMPYPRSRQLITYHELEIFVDWQYKFEIAKETYLMLYTGPTVQCGLAMDMRSDKQDYEGQAIDPVRYSGYSKDATPDQQFKRFNVTWGVGAGFQYQRYFLRGGYDFGLLVPYKNADFENGNHTRGRLDSWNIKIGMYLWYED
ncbi:MAG: outer membrane beta-barrel protein [Paludibacteraceae bacterium]|nr:outer membrane beta-barrel protein [Paludibacteraceae bacterium]